MRWIEEAVAWFSSSGPGTIEPPESTLIEVNGARATPDRADPAFLQHSEENEDGDRNQKKEAGRAEVPDGQ